MKANKILPMKKNLTKILCTVIILTFTNLAFSQTCATFEYESYLNSKFPGYFKALEQTRQLSLSESSKLNKADNDTVYQIPVVFHIVWNTKSQNIHDSLIYSQLKALNESFRHIHSDTGRVRSVFKPLAGDTRIEFVLATKDPNGKLTNGIDRFKTDQTDFGGNNGFAENVKSTFDYGVDAWNTAKYLNIWVCKFTYNGTPIISAYAFPPTNAQFWASSNFTASHLQGVVVNYQFIGIKNPNDFESSSMRERTLVHEVGHYLGLRHIWADKNNTCIGEDDGLKDTPNSRAANRNCNPALNTCNQGAGDQPDMIENYMDYTPYPCTVMFTQQQATLMRYNLLNLRLGLSQIKTDLPPPPVYTKISVAPNPVQGNLRIIFEQQGIYTIKLTDMIGQSITSGEFAVGDAFEYNKPLNVAAGIYYLNISNGDNEVLKQRILVQ